MSSHEEAINKRLTIHAQVMNKSRLLLCHKQAMSNEKAMNKPRTSHEQVMKYEQVIKDS